MSIGATPKRPRCSSFAAFNKTASNNTAPKAKKTQPYQRVANKTHNKTAKKTISRPLDSDDF